MVAIHNEGSKRRYVVSPIKILSAPCFKARHRLRVLLSVFAVILMCCDTAVCQDKKIPVFDFSVPPLKAPSDPEKSRARLITYWNGMILVSSSVNENGKWMEKYGRFDPKDNSVHALKIADTEEIVDLAGNRKHSFALCRSKGIPRLLKTEGSAYSQLSLPDDICKENSYRLAVSDKAVFMISKDTLFYSQMPKSGKCVWYEARIRNLVRTSWIEPRLPA